MRITRGGNGYLLGEANTHHSLIRPRVVRPLGIWALWPVVLQIYLIGSFIFHTSALGGLNGKFVAAQRRACSEMHLVVVAIDEGLHYMS